MEKKRKKTGKIIGGSVAGILFISYVSGMIYLGGKFMMNTTINGIDVSYDTVEEAEKKIAALDKQYELKLQERDDMEETITAEEIGYHYVSTGEIEKFKEEQKLAFWPVSLWKKHAYTFETSTEYDQKKLKKVMNDLKCFDANVEKAPEDAHLKLEETSYVVVPEEQGKKVRRKKLKNVLMQAVKESVTEISLEESDCYAKPEITQENEKLNTICKNLNRYTRTKVVYKFGEKEEILDGRKIGRWLSYDDAGEVTLNEDMVAQYVGQLAEHYDTYGKVRRFVTHDGSTVRIEGGKYGWLIDQEAETAELIKRIRGGGKENSREPVYAQTAGSHENCDLGHSYIEIDLTNQHLWMYEDGKEVVSTDIVSGTYTNSSRRTPGGIYSIYFKKSPAVLTSTKPGDSYASPVSFWMPFNGGIGLHDASWRGSFGGNIFQYSGSHGCVNLPYSAAKEIYGYAEKGTPVVLYYHE